MPDYRAIARREAKRAGLDPNVFVRQIGAESGFNPNARSPAGAQGIAQIMPATAKGWGVDPSDPVASLRAAAKNMAGYVRRYGSYENALRAYNAGPGNIAASRGFSETNRYVQNILGGRDPGKLNAPASVPADSSTPADQSGGQQLAALLLAKPEPQQPRPSMGLATPAFAAAPVMPVGAQQVASGTPRESPGASLASALTAIQGLQGPEAPAQPASPGSTGGGSDGRVKITGPNPDRIKPQVIQFASRISSILGEPIVGSDGTGHSYLTVNGRVSQHSTGNATDIPAAGADLIRKGRAALIAAGMPAAQARKQKGGLYNVNGKQIIFNTQEGGDHTDHLHIGVR